MIYIIIYSKENGKQQLTWDEWINRPGWGLLLHEPPLTLHREDGPAIAYSNPTDIRESWYKNGLLHRDFLPAVIESNGDKIWYKHGKITKQCETNKYMYEWIEASDLLGRTPK